MSNGDWDGSSLSQVLASRATASSQYRPPAAAAAQYNAPDISLSGGRRRRDDADVHTHWGGDLGSVLRPRAALLHTSATRELSPRTAAALGLRPVASIDRAQARHAAEWGGNLGDMLRPSARAAHSHRDTSSGGNLSPRTAAAIGLRAAPRDRDRAQAEWGGDLGSVLDRATPQVQSRHDQSVHSPDAHSPEHAHQAMQQGSRAQEWAGDLGSVLATTAPAKARIPRSRATQASSGVLGALTAHNPGATRPMRDGDAQVRHRPPSAQQTRVHSARGGSTGGGNGSGGGRGDEIRNDNGIHNRNGDNLSEIQLSPVRTDVLPSAAPIGGGRL